MDKRRIPESDTQKQEITARKGLARVRLRTIYTVILLGIFVSGILIYQLFRIQIIQHENYQKRAIDQQTREWEVTASRGSIYDRNGETLAQSATAMSVFVSPAELITYDENPEYKTYHSVDGKRTEYEKLSRGQIAQQLTEILGEFGSDYETIMAKWDRTNSMHEWIARRLEPAVSDKVRDFIAQYNLKSVHLAEDSKRYYPNDDLAAQILGFVNAENSGGNGLESFYESTLRGVNGRMVRATNARGTEMLNEQYENYYTAIEGNSITLTIDAKLQGYLEKHLAQAIIDNHIQNGAMGIIMDVNTGAILAAATLPDYDPNNYSTLNPDSNEKLKALINEGKVNEFGDTVTYTDGERAALLNEALNEQWRSRVFSDTYEPGSTFKIITLAIGLDTGAVSENDNFPCGGKINVLGREDPVHCWRLSGHNDQTLKQAVQHSCNVAFVTIGLRIGARRFYDYVKAFGLQTKTGIDFSGEGGGVIGVDWWEDDVFMDTMNQSQLASASFGQTFAITPLQLLTAVSAVVNGGYLMQPYLVQTITAPDGTVLKSNKPTEVRQVISEQTSEICREMLEAVVSGVEGTGKNAQVPGYRIGGKTGTSQDIGHQTDEYKVSFVGFAPADNPQIACLVILDSPDRALNGNVSGGTMAAPIVGKIFADALPLLGIRPEITNSAEAISTIMPNVKSLSIAEAASKLEDVGLQVRIFGSGTTVLDQAPFANYELDKGSQVILYTDTYKPTDLVSVPDISGMSYKDARGTLEVSGLFIRAVGVAPSDKSTIVAKLQSQDPGTEVARGIVVEVTMIDNDTSLMEGIG
ncbi:MAG: PASTA domain-containing protein [Oscillospiraceae bacterium]|jgi:stage V sporulation protein D (sporulation-specific penicillin-binding protein)|nr:PASTA domain-containing protein [Oscillospiraceae bacterium]